MIDVTNTGNGKRALLHGGLLLFSLMLASVAMAADDSIVFESTDTPPFWAPSLPDNGLSGAILKLLSANAGIQYSIEFLPVKRFRNSHAAYLVGDPDILVNEKQRTILPFGVFRSAFFYYKPHQDVIEFHGLKDLRGHTLGVLRGTLEDKAAFLKNGINIEESDTVESLLRKLRRGRVDLCVMVDLTGKFVIKKLFPAEQDQFVTVDIPSSVRPIAIMIDISNPQGSLIAQRYRNVLDKTISSQEYNDILDNFYGKDKLPSGRMERLREFEQYYSGGRRY
jgi:polar amino acid transport system substrate-binding protein